MAEIGRRPEDLDPPAWSPSVMLYFPEVSSPFDRTKADPRVSALKVRQASLEAATSPPVRIRIEGTAPIVVGSSDACDLRLTEDETVSRVHARFALTDGGVLVVDEGSRNGTWLGPMRIQRAVVVENARLRVGNTGVALLIDEVETELTLSKRTRLGDAIGFSPAIRHVFWLLERAAGAEVTLLLEGESGVGKEVLARAVHDLSARAEGPMVTVDCGAIPKELLESELFGHERGAFTGADKARIGLFEQANGGTLFLDELGELPIDLQPKLLRALEAREVRPVGANRPRRIDVRVIAATNRNLLEEVRRGGFRQDLYYRVSVARVRIPPLRDRPGDIDVLATDFYREALRDDGATIPHEVLDLLRAYRWPGNVRELRNVVQRYGLLGFSGRALFDHASSTAIRVSPPASGGASSATSDWVGRKYHDARQIVLDRFEHEFTRDALARANGVMLRAAELAGMARSSFYRMVEKHGIRTPEP
jgi:transcriptional regulator with GAF, ATPase, and Fis domain